MAAMRAWNLPESVDLAGRFARLRCPRRAEYENGRCVEAAPPVTHRCPSQWRARSGTVRWPPDSACVLLGTMASVTARLPTIWYGGDYNPEQWPPETWDEDVRLM